MFLFVLFYVTIYLFLIEKYKPSFLSFLPAFIIYFLVSGLQFNVGTDYFNYISLYFSDTNIHFSKKEYFFHYLLKSLKYLSLPAQSLFISISFIQSILIFYYFKSIKHRGYVLWIFFFTFICVTNIYNNQLNGLRQYVVVCFVPIMTLILYEKKYLWYLICVLLATFFHSSAIFLVILIPIRFFYNILHRNIFITFILMPFFYMFMNGFLESIVPSLFPQYIHYLDSAFSEGVDFSSYITKLYYLPGILYFYYLYKNTEESSNQTYFGFMIVIFSIFYWLFITSNEIGIASRIFVYFLFFYTFPIYYLLKKTFLQNKPFTFYILIVYVFLPYFLKVTFFARGEFLYKNILF